MTTSRPNLVVVFADQLRGQDLGCAGNPDVQTPTIDRLAAEGVMCSRAFANSPVCTPSRGTLLTGQYPLTHKAMVNDLPLPPGTPTIATTLRDEGYRTGYIGKWHLDGVPRSGFTPPGPRRQGFDFWAVYNCSHDYFRKEKYYRDSPEPERIDGYEPAVQTDLACDFIAQTDDQPFALFVSWGPPHNPYDQVPEEFRRRYDPEALTLRANVQDVDESTNPLVKGLSLRRTTADYYAAITALDTQLARILDSLDRQGQAENTIVVFTSDHGDLLFSHGLLRKQLPWEESVRIPMLVRWPEQLPAGYRTNELISMVDLMPTLLGLLDAEHPAPMQGTDRSSLLRGTGTGADAVLLMDILPVTESSAQGFDEWRGVRTDRYTYVERLGHGPWLLYDNESDPWQLSNLIGSPSLGEMQGRLADLLHTMLDEVGDRFLSGPDHLRDLGLADLWNTRELDMHADAPDLLI